MNAIEYDECSERLLDKADDIASAKRPGYTIGHDDVLKNFKRVAERLNITPLQAWGVYALKHFDAITTYARDPAIPQAEAIEGRFCDAINYLLLGFALHVEQRGVSSGQ